MFLNDKIKHSKAHQRWSDQSRVVGLHMENIYLQNQTREPVFGNV